MRSFNNILIISYFILLVAGTVFFYFYNYPAIMNLDNENSNFVPSDSQELIYFQAEDKVKSVNSSVLIDRIGNESKFQTANNSPQSISFKGTSFFEVNSGDPGISEIDLATGLARNVVSIKTAGFENMDNFGEPQISPDGQILLFKAGHNGIDYLFAKNLETNSFKNLTESFYSGKINSSAWSPNGKEIVFSGQIASGSKLESFGWKGLDNKTIIRETNETISEVKWSKNGIYFIEDADPKNQTLSNLYFYDLGAKKIKAISQTASPSSVTNFSISPDGKLVSFTITNRDSGQSDLMVCQANGSNLLQITNNQKAFYPIFSPSSLQIVFWEKGDGLFTVDADSSGMKKIFNEQGTIQQLYAWR